MGLLNCCVTTSKWISICLSRRRSSWDTAILLTRSQAASPQHLRQTLHDAPVSRVLRSHQHRREEPFSDSLWLYTSPPAFQPLEQMESSFRADHTFLSSGAAPFLQHRSFQKAPSMWNLVFLPLWVIILISAADNELSLLLLDMHTHTHHFLVIANRESKSSAAHRLRVSWRFLLNILLK